MRIYLRHPRSVRVRSRALLLIAPGVLAWPTGGLAASDVPTPPMDLGVALTQIQNTCFAAYSHRTSLLGAKAEGVEYDRALHRIANHDGVEVLRRASVSTGAEPRPPQ